VGGTHLQPLVEDGVVPPLLTVLVESATRPPVSVSPCRFPQSTLAYTSWGP